VAVPFETTYSRSVHPRARPIPTALATAAVATALLPLGVAIAKDSVHAPKSGTYDGGTQQHKPITLYISRKSIDLAAFSFKCRGTEGQSGLNAIKLVKAKNGYKFSLKAHGSISFKDEQPDENGKIDIAGRFTKSGVKATGTLRVRSPRCQTGSLDWRVRR
jgi:hypothetical protein